MSVSREVQAAKPVRLPVRVTSHNPSRRGLRSVVAGGITGGINICIVFPTEFIKTQLQLDNGRTVYSPHYSILSGRTRTAKATSLNSSQVKLYTGSADVVRQTVRERGLGGMYRGVTVLLTGTVPTYAVRFGTFDTLKGYCVGRDGVLAPAARMLCGLGAGVAEAVLVITWMETLKVRLIKDSKRKVPQFRGIYHAASSIIKKEGVSGLYKGLGPTILKQGSNQAIRFSCMESLRMWYTGGDLSRPVPFPVVALFGAVAGGTSVLANTPVDVVKTRMQSGAHSSSLQCIRQVAIKEGVRGFYKGCMPRLNRVCLEVGLAFCIFDTVQELFNKVWPA